MLWLRKISLNTQLCTKTAHAEIPPDFPPDLSSDMNLLHEEKQWHRAVSTPGSLVKHDEEGWTGSVVELRGDPVNGGKVLVEHEMEGRAVQRFYSALDFSPVMQMTSPFRRSFNTNWMQKMSQQQQKLFVIVRGPSGSGKSRMTEELVKKHNAPVFSTDDFWMINGTYQFDREYIGEAHFWNQGRVEEAMQGGAPVVILDNTNTRFSEMKPYVEMAQKYGYGVTFKEPDWHSDLKTPEGEWDIDFLEKMQNQPDREKVVPRDVLEQMVGGYEYNPTVESVLRSERPDSP